MMANRNCAQRGYCSKVLLDPSALPFIESVIIQIELFVCVCVYVYIQLSLPPLQSGGDRSTHGTDDVCTK